MTLDGPSSDLPEPPADLSIKPPNPPGVSASWHLIAHNKSVLKAWEALCRATPEDAQHCYSWLSHDAMLGKRQRCYALKGKAYAGCWAYEIGRANRVYYRPDKSSKSAVIYYAGPHPHWVPTLPKGI